MSSIVNRDAERAERAAAWATRLADGSIPDNQELDFQHWLDADPANREAMEEIVGAWETVEYYAASDAMMELRQSAIATARRESAGRSFAVSAPARRWLLIAASLILVILGAGSWLLLQPDSYQTGIGERRLVVLADGSKISLDANTLVKVSFSSATRKLWLERGRAKFDVAKNPLRPFSVQAGNEIVVATGTAFSVERLRDQVHVVLYEGHVALLNRKSTSAASDGHVPIQVDRALTPGREAIVRDDGLAADEPKLAMITSVDPVRSLSWESGQLVFDDEPLGTVVERVNRYTDKPLRIGDPSVAGLRMSGVFQAGDIGALVQGLAAEFGVRAEEDADFITLYRPQARSAQARTRSSAPPG